MVSLDSFTLHHVPFANPHRPSTVREISFDFFVLLDFMMMIRNISLREARRTYQWFILTFQIYEQLIDSNIGYVK